VVAADAERTRAVIRIGGNVWYLHNVPSQGNTSYDRIATDGLWMGAVVRPMLRRSPAARRESKEITVAEEAKADVSATDRPRLGGNLVENRLEFERSATDDSQHPPHCRQG
jgi:hypothetical protein